ncbi:MAG: gamma-glutamyl-gamma-aminobutyrate hydrolase family protein [Actinomycetota bacterium]|nr:gamma-glutamyl-gamma-aminobutyrate hydrolase family protein [Actinomycetota bacterium]
MRPLIGVTGYVEEARWGLWETRVTLLPQRYVDAVHAAGGRAVVVPPFADGADAVVAALDGLILSGGPDIDPRLYRAQPDPHLGVLRPDRDDGELALVHAATAADLPVLGVCRGMQLMCVAAGGALIQHLPDRIGTDVHRPVPGQYAEHPVRTVAGSRLAGVLDPTLSVPSSHHQGIEEAGALTISAHADDGTVEGVERPAAHFALGVLWHPEVSSDLRLFQGLVAAAGGDR